MIRTAVSILAICGFASASLAQTCGTPWTQFAGMGPESATVDAATAFDSARSRIVAFFGSGLTPGTWEWDGSGTGSWSLRTTTGPGPRTDPAMAFDSVRQKTILFGGQSGSTNLTDTWEWDGTTWTQRIPATSPAAAAFNSSMAYDLVRGVTVLSQPSSNKTWEWNGTNWDLRASAYAQKLTFEPGRGRVVGFGFAPKLSLVEWNGSAWTMFSAAVPLVTATLAAGPVPGHLIAMGRYFNPPDTGPIDTWEYDNAADRWVLRARQGPQFAETLAPDGAGFITFSTSAPFRTWRYNPALSGGPTIVSPAPLYFTNVPSGSTFSMQVTATGTGTLTYQWRRNGVPLNDGGVYSGTHTPTLTLTNIGIGAAEFYDTVVTDDCGSTSTHASYVTVQCYANCDGNASLNANDFQCYLNVFAQLCSSPVGCYVNCDQSTTSPFLNANDFQCFMNKYAGGCT